MFAFIVLAAVLSMFAVLAMVLEHGASSASWAMTLNEAGTPCEVSRRAENDVLIARLHRSLTSPTMTRVGFTMAMHRKHVTGRTLAPSDRELCKALQGAGISADVVAHTASLLAY